MLCLNNKKAVIVIGGGIAGVQASLDLADRGLRVYLVEETPSIGGRMAQLDKTFPTMDCSICILAPKMIECFRHPNITLLTVSEVKAVNGSAGNFIVKVLKKPRYVDEEKCVGCGVCSEKCPVNVPNEFDMGFGMRKAIYIPFKQAVPLIATIDKAHCLFFQKGVCKICQKFCEANAIDFVQEPKELALNISAIIVATGLDLFDPSAVNEYGYKRYKNVILSLELERLLSASGPTGGELLRPSDSKTPHRTIFVQCVGSRSQRGELPYCSSVCCMYATKEAILIREHEPECEVYILHMGLKVFGKGFQEFVDRAQKDWGVKYINGRPSSIQEVSKEGDLLVRYEDILNGGIKEMKADLVVLCSALIPRRDNEKLAEILNVDLDEYGFFKSKDMLFAPIDTTIPGVFMCGYCQGPKDIPESVAQASAAADRAAEVIVLAASGEAH